MFGRADVGRHCGLIIDPYFDRVMNNLAMLLLILIELRDNAIHIATLTLFLAEKFYMLRGHRPVSIKTIGTVT